MSAAARPPDLREVAAAHRAALARVKWSPPEPSQVHPGGLRVFASLDSGIAWPSPPPDGGDFPVDRAAAELDRTAAACERARLLLAELDLADLPLRDARRTQELRHRLREPDAKALREATALLARLRPAQSKQATALEEVRAVSSLEARIERAFAISSKPYGVSEALSDLEELRRETQAITIEDVVMVGREPTTAAVWYGDEVHDVCISVEPLSSPKSEARVTVKYGTGDVTRRPRFDVGRGLQMRISTDRVVVCVEAGERGLPEEVKVRVQLESQVAGAEARRGAGDALIKRARERGRLARVEGRPAGPPVK